MGSIAILIDAKKGCFYQSYSANALAPNPKYESYYGCGYNIPRRKIFNYNGVVSYSIETRLARIALQGTEYGA